MGVKILRYLVIPILGLVAARMTVHWTSRRELPFGKVDDLRAAWILALLMSIGSVVMGGLLWVKYATWHSVVLDLGTYDQKVWLISRQGSWWGMLQQTWKGGVEVSPCGLERQWGICHFQPSYLLLGLLYKIWPSPLVLLTLQVLLVVSGVIPVFLLAHDRLGRPVAGFLTAALYLLYPAVQFNGMWDFRPDHVAIPAVLWGFLLLERGYPVRALVVVASMTLVKETLILSFAFFGLYLWVRHERRVISFLSFGLGLLLYYWVTFHLLASETMSEGKFFLSHFFPTLSGAGGSGSLLKVLANPLMIVRTAAQPYKLVYLAALFGPVAFLPLLSPLPLVVAIPPVAISMLSLLWGHATIQSHYSAAAVGPIFMALLGSLQWLDRRFGRRAAPVPILAGLVVLSTFASLAVGPTPLSINFWSRTWGGNFLPYTQYLPDRQEVLDRAAGLIPTDPRIVVVTQNDLNSAPLAHRNSYFPFPVAVDRADYIFLDKHRAPLVAWAYDPEGYEHKVSQLLRDPAFEVCFEREGILLLRRRASRYLAEGLAEGQRATRSGCPADRRGSGGHLRGLSAETSGGSWPGRGDIPGNRGHPG